MNKLNLRPDQTRVFMRQSDRLDGIAEGFALGIQHAKKALLEAVLAIPEPPKQEATPDGNQSS